MGTKANPGKFDCYAKAADDEPIFVLRAKDPLAAHIVGKWADLYWSVTKSPDMEKLSEARRCVRAMREYAGK